jgi:hypothetical protein
MASKHQRAMDALDLAENPIFQEVCREVKDASISVFLDPRATPESLARAHEGVRAVETFMAALKARADDWALEQKRTQDRGND